MERIVDEIEIKSLLVRERFYRDTFQWQKLRDCYNRDAAKTAINVSWFKGSVDDFVERSRQMQEGGTRASHTITPVEVNIVGKKALSQSTGSIAIRFKMQEELYDCISYARFVSRLQKEDHGWRLLSLDAIYERDTIVPVVPSTPRPAELQMKHFRESYMCISWLLSQSGFNINQDLPGIDRPELVDAFMATCTSWLFDS